MKFVTNPCRAARHWLCRFTGCDCHELDMTGWRQSEKDMAAQLGHAEIARGIDVLPDDLRTGTYSEQARSVVQMALGWIE